MPGLLGASSVCSKDPSGSPAAEKTTRPSRRGWKLLRSVRWVTSVTGTPATTGGCSTKASNRSVHTVAWIVGTSSLGEAAGGWS